MVFAFLFTVGAFSILRGGFYVLSLTILVCCIFEIVAIFLWGLLAKNMSIVKLVHFHLFL